MKLFLDDIRDPYRTTHVQLPLGPWEVVRNYNEFCKAICSHFNDTKSLPEFIAFDHDLADDHYVPDAGGGYYPASTQFKEKTGYDCAQWLVDFCMDNNLKMCNYIVHSMNPVGKKRIESLLNCFTKSQNLNN